MKEVLDPRDNHLTREKEAQSPVKSADTPERAEVLQRKSMLHAGCRFPHMAGVIGRR